MNGWIKIHRKMRQWQHYKNPYIRMVFEDMLLSADASGNAVTSIAAIQCNTGVSKPIIIKAIKALKASGEITHTLDGNTSIYHIVNYCLYQAKGGKRDLPQTEKGSKQDLPQVVNEVYQGGKRGLPHYKNNKNKQEDIVVANAHARTHEDFIAEALSPLMVEQGCMAMGIDPAKYQQLVTEVINDWQFRSLPDNEWNKTHLLAQMRIKHNINNRNNGNNTQSSSADSIRAKLDQDAVKAMAALAAESRQPKIIPF